MVESDQAEGSNQKEMASSGVSDDTIELKHKRQRVESSDDESLEISIKKRRTSDNEAVLQNQDLELNGERLSTGESTVNVKAKHVDNDEELNESKDEDEINKPESPKGNEQHKEEEDENEDTAKKPTKVEALEVSPELTNKKESSNMEVSIENDDDDNADKPESPKQNKDLEKEKDENENSNKKLIKSEASSGLEVVEGLELSVECASEKESSSSENEEEKTRVPKTKTTIVKAKPTDSELEIGSSEADLTDEEDESVGNSLKEAKGKRGRKKGTKKSLTQDKNSGSEDTNNSKSDEEYNPKTKGKVKKNVTTKKPSESKRGRGRARKKTPKPEEKIEDKEDDGSGSTNEAENTKKEEGESDNQSGSISDNDSETESQSKGKGSKKESSSKSGHEKRLDSLKKYIRAAGVHVKSYNELFAKCKTNADKETCLKDLLEKNGVSGRPSLEKCKKAKIRNETLRDISELNTSNIISGVRVTRSQRNMGQNKDLKKPSETPPKQREGRSSFKRIMSVVDSDSE